MWKMNWKNMRKQKAGRIQPAINQKNMKLYAHILWIGINGCAHRSMWFLISKKDPKTTSSGAWIMGKWGKQTIHSFRFGFRLGAWTRVQNAIHFAFFAALWMYLQGADETGRRAYSPDATTFATLASNGVSRRSGQMCSCPKGLFEYNAANEQFQSNFPFSLCASDIFLTSDTFSTFM